MPKFSLSYWFVSITFEKRTYKWILWVQYFFTNPNMIVGLEKRKLLDMLLIDLLCPISQQTTDTLDNLDKQTLL